MYDVLTVLAVSLALQWDAVAAQEEASCATPIAASVVLTLIVAAILVALAYFLWKRYMKARKGHLIVEADPEKGKAEYAFDNPGFRDAGLTPVGKVLEKSKVDSGGGKTKWNQWSPLGVLTLKNEKKQTVDDSALDQQEKVVTLRSHDFIGLGFNICGNMKDGIFIKDILNRGPAIESGLSSGDRINAVTISFEHIVYEDAIAILSYASPYEVTIDAKSGRVMNYPGQGGKFNHPIFKSSSTIDLAQMGKTSSKKRLFHSDDHHSDIGSNHSSLQKNRSTVTTLERTKSKSPKPNQKLLKPKNKLSPDQLKIQLEENILEDYKETMRMKQDMEQPVKAEAEHQKAESKQPKFGIPVFPMDNIHSHSYTHIQQKSPKIAEQNENNINHEKSEPAVPIMGIDEVDRKKVVAPPVKKREKIPPSTKQVELIQPELQRDDLNGSGIKRDKNNIPLEIPNNMLNAAMAARKNRKSVEEDDLKSPKKTKGKAPAPPPEPMNEKFDEIYAAEETLTLNKSDDSIEKMRPELMVSTTLDKSDVKDYNSDSDVEIDNQSSVNTIELNASDITIHQSEENEEKQNRKTASTGDLSKIQKTRKTSSGTLERAQSLDITDTAMPSLAKKRKAGRIEDSFDSKTSSDESLYGSALINKEPRLSLILDGLNTFQRSRLKKSTEWGKLEDAILRHEGSAESLDKANSSYEDLKLSNENLASLSKLSAKSPEFDALVNKINEIKQETIEIINEQERNDSTKVVDFDMTAESDDIIDDVPKSMQTMSRTIEEMPKSIEAVTLQEVDAGIKNNMKDDVESVIQAIKEVAVKDDDAPQDVRNKIWPVAADDDNKVRAKLNFNDPTEKAETVKLDKPNDTSEVKTTLTTNFTINQYMKSEENNDDKIKPNVTSFMYNNISKPNSTSYMYREVEETSPKKINDMSNVTVTRYNNVTHAYQNETEQPPSEVSRVTVSQFKLQSKPENHDNTFTSVNIVDDMNDVINFTTDAQVSVNKPDDSLTYRINNADDVKILKSNVNKPDDAQTFSTNDLQIRINKPDDAFIGSVQITQVDNDEPSVSVSDSPVKVNRISVTEQIENKEHVHTYKIQPAERTMEQSPHKPTITHKLPKTEVPTSTKLPKAIAPPRSLNIAHVNNFIMAERVESSRSLEHERVPPRIEETNVSDDIKVSRHTLGTDNEKRDNVSNITINDSGVTAPQKYEVSVNKAKTKKEKHENVIVSTPDLIKNITIAEAIHDLNNEVTVEGPTSLTFEIPASNIEPVIKEAKLNGIQMKPNGDIKKLEVPPATESEKSNNSLTYITEIQVTTNNNNKNKNISEIEITPHKNLDNEFENYIKNFETNIKCFENNIQTFEQTIKDVAQTTTKETKEPPVVKTLVVNDKVEAQKELMKVQEIVEEQLKTLPEMRFTTSSYESQSQSQIKPSEKRQSQIEILRSNFERNASPTHHHSKRSESSPPKSRIPVLNKTPPTSPERRDSRNLETEPDKEILEIMSSNLKYQPKAATKNVTVTSIRSNSKIPSGLPTYSNNSRPPVPPRKADDNVVQVSTNGDSNFKQWVFNPSDSAVTNITVTETKYERK